MEPPKKTFHRYEARRSVSRDVPERAHLSSSQRESPSDLKLPLKRSASVDEVDDLFRVSEVPLHLCSKVIE
jgi:hypothetical protein